MKNDWIVANLNNPDFTVSDFQNIADMSTSNTQMLSKDQYLKSDFIKSNEAFKDEQGRFSQKKFDDFYNSAAKSFQDFRTHNTTDGLEYDIFDIRRTPDSKVKRDNLRREFTANVSHELKTPLTSISGFENPYANASILPYTSEYLSGAISLSLSGVFVYVYKLTLQL